MKRSSRSSRNSRRTRKKQEARNWRIQALKGFFSLAAVIIVFRLGHLQIVQASFYQSLASGQHSFYKELFSERGDIIIRDWGDDTEYLAATNELRGFVYADPRKIEDPVFTTQELSRMLGYDIPPADRDKEAEEQLKEEQYQAAEAAAWLAARAVAEETGAEVIPPTQIIVPEQENKADYTDYDILFARLSKEDDPYEPVARNVEDQILQQIIDLQLEGIDYVLEKGRSYPEKNIGGHIFGFLGMNNEGALVGSYGLEGSFEDFLAGKNGYLDSETDASGRWVGVGSRDFVPAEDGGDLVLTIDRTIQYIACKKLAEGVDRYDADSGSLVIMEPYSGRIMAMCNVPDFDPAIYNEVEDFSVYRNLAISGAYEVGSVFKPLVMAAGIDAGVVGPDTLYNDTGAEEIDEFTIRNSDLEAYGMQSMTHVLEKSLNTGMIFVMRQLGMPKMLQYLQDFGFGTMTGIELYGEAPGDISSLDIQSEIYYATASYGQGVTATVLQLASAYSAIANGGNLMRPYIVEEKRYSNGTVEEIQPEIIRQVLTKKTATTVSAMLVSVIENGHGTKAAVDGYFMGGKTGTAQVAKENGRGYETGQTKVTFAGFGPIEQPAFTMIIMMDHPKATEWAADSAAPMFGEISEFLVQYLQIPPTRSIE